MFSRSFFAVHRQESRWRKAIGSAGAPAAGGAGCGTGCRRNRAAAPAPEAATEEAAAESDLAYVKEKGVLVVGITDFAPMDYKNEDGEWIGFDADMAKEFAKKILCLENSDEECTCKSCTCFNGLNHPDFYCINEEGETIKVDPMRELTEKVIEKPIVSRKKDKEHHGFGIKSIEKEIEGIGGVLDISHDNERFVAKVVIPL